MKGDFIPLQPQSHQSCEPSVHRDIHTRLCMCFFCRVGSDISSTGFAGAGACFAMKRQVLVLPFEVDAREKETLPALGLEEHTEVVPLRAPLMLPPPP